MGPELTLYCSSPDPYTRYGLEHFRQKYGFQAVNHPEYADIFVDHLFNQDISSRLQIILYPNTNEQSCCLSVDGQTIPLFTRPKRTTGDRNLGRVLSDDGGEYNCLSIVNNKVIVGFDIFNEIGKILAGNYDVEFTRKGLYGMALRSIPVVDLLEETLFSAIQQVIPYAGKRFAWPGGHKFALVLTHDVDRVYKTYQYLPSIINSLKELNISKLAYHLHSLLFKHGRNNPYWTFDSMCELEESLGVKSSYYFLNERGKHNPFSLRSWILYRGVYDIESQPVKEVIRQLYKQKFEIGVHGSYNSYNNPALLQSEKDILESIIETPIRGIRQHFLNYDNSCTANNHLQCGFGYDSTLGFSPEVGMGFSRGTCFPFPIMLPDLRISSVIEIPLIIMDIAVKMPVDVIECLNLLNQVEKYSGVLTILWHTRVFNRQEYPRMIPIYEEIIRQARARNAWIATAEEVYEWIIKSRGDTATDLVQNETSSKV
jgi:peptidoglycan/xylan/chitin deacetylase (PgdA/CDA1 family)